MLGKVCSCLQCWSRCFRCAYADSWHEQFRQNFHQLHKWKHRAACVSQRQSINLEYLYHWKDHLDANKRKSIQQCSHVGSGRDNGKITANNGAGGCVSTQSHSLMQTSSVNPDKNYSSREEEGLLPVWDLLLNCSFCSDKIRG